MEEKILSIIEHNARIDLADLAMMIGTDEVTVVNMLADLEKKHIIRGYHTMINWENTSREIVTALIEVKVTPQRGSGFDKLAEHIYNYPEVDELYLMSGTFDFTLIIEGRTMREVAAFVSEKLSTLDQITSTATHFVLKKYKSNGTVLVPPTRDERIMVTP